MSTLYPAQITIPLEPWHIRHHIARFLDHTKQCLEFADREMADLHGHWMLTPLPSVPEPFPVIINDIAYRARILEVANRRGMFANVAVCCAPADNEQLPSMFFVIERNADNYWVPKNHLLTMAWEEFFHLDIGERYTLLLAAD